MLCNLSLTQHSILPAQSMCLLPEILSYFITSHLWVLYIWRWEILFLYFHKEYLQIYEVTFKWPVQNSVSRKYLNSNSIRYLWLHNGWCSLQLCQQFLNFSTLMHWDQLEHLLKSFLVQQVWGKASKFTFLTRFQIMLMLPVPKQLRNQCFAILLWKITCPLKTSSKSETFRVH
jgi:hypothetical protein